MRRAVRLVGALFLLYFVFVAIGLFPTNIGFQPAASGVEILVSSTAIHADILMPIATDAIDWRNEFPTNYFRGDTESATHIAIGWGDRGFFLHTRYWSDLRASTLLWALFWPSEACLHVTMCRPETYASKLQRLRLTPEQYQRLVASVRSSFVRDEQGVAVRIEGFAYEDNDAFFQALGSYHALNTCNSWSGRMLQSAGVRTPCWTPLPKTVFLYWPGE